MAEGLTLDRDLPADPETIFAAITRRDSLREWFWPPRFATEVEVDLRPRGAYSIRSGPVGIGVSGSFSRIDVPNLLAFTWRWDGEPNSTQVQVSLKAVSSITRLTLIHEGFSTVEERDNHIQGWTDCLNRLDALLQNRT